MTEKELFELIKAKGARDPQAVVSHITKSGSSSFSLLKKANDLGREHAKIFAKLAMEVEN